MTVETVLLSFLIGTSVVMTIAMAVAWLHFGRQRHVLTWTVAYAVCIVQWLANAAAYASQSKLLYGVTGIGIIVSTSLLAAGIRQRSGRPVSIGMFAPPVAIATIATIVSVSSLGTPSMQGMIVPAFVGVLMAISAVSLWPRERRFTSPERAFFGMLIAYAALQLALVASSVFITGSGEGKELYRAILALTMPTVYAGTGMAAVLVVAGDLAEELRKQISHDAMTGILNRRGLEEAASRAIALAQRNKRPLAMVVSDLDGFKALNDRQGHIAGDMALRSFAGLLKTATRRGDVVARMGGDEFGLLLVDSDAQAAAQVMERVRSETQHVAIDSIGAALSASFGITQISPEDRVLDDLVRRADAALYDAKRAGRDRIGIRAA